MVIVLTRMPGSRPVQTKQRHHPPYYLDPGLYRLNIGTIPLLPEFISRVAVSTSGRADLEAARR